MRHAYAIASLLALGCFFGYSIGKIYGFTILPDEFGYWFYAAAAAGYDWSEIVSLSSYYSYGYSIILFPVFVLFQDGLTAYRAAIAVNFVMLAGIGFMLRYLVARIFPDEKGQLTSVFAAVITLYPPLLLYARTTMAETMLVFLYVLAVVLVYRYLERRKAFRLFLVLVVLVCIHFVHMRTVALLIAGLLTALIDRLFLYTDTERRCAGRENRSVLYDLLAVAAAFALFMLGMYVRSGILDTVYGGHSEISQINDYQGQSGKFQYIMTLEGLGNLLVSVAGKILYLGLATFGTALWGLWYAWKAVMFGKERRERLFWCFVLLSAMGALAVNAVYTVYPGRVDTLAYGRYHEYVFPVLMAAGLYEMWHTCRLRKGMLRIAGLELCMLIPVLYSLHRYHQTSLHACMIFGMSYLYDAGDSDPVRFYVSAYGFGVLLTVAVTVLVGIGRKAKNRMALIFLIAVMEVLLALRAASVVTDTGSIGAYRDSVVADKITGLMEGDSDRKVLYLNNPDSGGNSTVGMIQFLLRDTEITVLDRRENVDDYGENEMGIRDLVLTDYRDDYGGELSRRYAYTLSSGHFILYYNRASKQ